MKYGYARVSTKSQELGRQLDMLSDCDFIFQEKMSGVHSNRPELNKLKETAIEGDTLVIESFSRLGRSTKDLIDLVDFFEAKGVKLVSLKENFDTSTPQGKLMMTVFQAFSQFERDIIAERTKEGLAAARARGRVGGRPSLISKKNKKKVDIAFAVELLRSGECSVKEICKNTGISKASLYRYAGAMEEN